MPRRDFTDERGADVVAGVYRHREALLRIGGGSHPLELKLDITSPGLVQTGSCFGEGDVGNGIYLALNSHAYFGNTAATALYTVVLPHQSAKFGVYTQNGGQGPLIVVPGDAAYVTGSFDSTHFNYVGGDGTEATFSSLHTAHPDAQSIVLVGNADQVRFPDGETWTYRYNDVTASFTGCQARMSRVRSIVSSRGYALQFDYGSDATGTVTSQSVIQAWISPARATAYNKAVIYCDETLLQSCASVAALNSAVTFAYDRPNRRVTITKPNGEQVELTFGMLMDTAVLTAVTRPGGVTRTMTYDGYAEQEGSSYRYLTTLTEAGRTWGYAIGSAADPSGAVSHYFLHNGTPYSILDPLNRQSWVDYDGYMRLLRHRYPEGNEVTTGYDTRGNLNLVRHIPKPNSGLPTLEARAVYPPACAAIDRRSCNQPISVTDRNNNTTDYTYSPDHGGVLTATGPAPAAGAPRPQTRNLYEARHAWISNGAGGYVGAGSPIWVRTETSICRTSAATGIHASPCATPGDEVRTTYDYGPYTGANNLLLRGQAVAADGINLRICYGYDQQGNRISETQPEANLASCP